MPSAQEYISPETPELRKGFDGELNREKAARRNRYQQALRYYLGTHTPQLELPDSDDIPDDNMTINMVKMTVNRTKNFLFPDMPTIELDPTTVEDTEEEKWAKAFIEENGGLAMLHKLALRGCLSGHNYVRIVPPKVKKKGVYPRIIVLNPTDVMTYWRGDDIADVIWYEYRYMVGDTLYIEDVVKADDEQSWTVYTYKAITSNANEGFGVPTHHGSAGTNIDIISWGERQNFELVKKEKHNFPIPPIIEWAHLPHPDDYYGQNEFTYDLVSLQDKINRTASERARIVRENSDPVDFIAGVSGDELENKGGLVTTENAAARAQRLELRSDLASINAVLQNLMETYLSIAMVVLLKGEAKDLQRVTNASVRTLFLDMLSKNTLLQSAYGMGLKKIIKLGMAMGIATGQINKAQSEITVNIEFGSSLPVDLFEVAQINQIMVTMGGRSLQTAATKMGDDWAREQAQMDAELEMQVERMTKMQEAMPEQEVGPDGKPTGKPSADKQHEMAKDMEQTKAKAKPDTKVKQK